MTVLIRVACGVWRVAAPRGLGSTKKHICVRNPYRGSQVQQPGCIPALALVLRGPHAPSEFALLTMFTVVSLAAVSCCCSFYQNDAARADCRKAGDPVLGAS